MNIAFPFAIGLTGLVETADASDHLYQMIQQILFTSPGERVNRPHFGSEIRRLVFSPAGGEMSAAVESMAQAVLHQWMGSLIKVQSVGIQVREDLVTVTVEYAEISGGKKRLAQFVV